MRRCLRSQLRAHPLWVCVKPHREVAFSWVLELSSGRMIWQELKSRQVQARVAALDYPCIIS
jgi:hypothetical protein